MLARKSLLYRQVEVSQSGARHWGLIGLSQGGRNLWSEHVKVEQELKIKASDVRPCLGTSSGSTRLLQYGTSEDGLFRHHIDPGDNLIPTLFLPCVSGLCVSYLLANDMSSSPLG